MATISEAILDIAGMGTELPMAVAIDAELLAAVRASECIDRLPLHQLGMSVPPFVTTGIAAESFPLASRILFNGLSTLLTD